MMRSIVRGGLVSAAAVGIVATGGMASSASAQNIAAHNLVNVQIDDVLNNNRVDVDVVVPITVAAAICDTTVAVLSTELADGVTECTSRAGQTVDVTTIQG